MRDAANAEPDAMTRYVAKLTTERAVGLKDVKGDSALLPRSVQKCAP